jgi:hypothetical protein
VCPRAGDGAGRESLKMGHGPIRSQSTGQPAVPIEAEVGSGRNGSRPKLRRLLADPRVSTVVVEPRDRLLRMNAELVGAALSAHGRGLVMIDEGDGDDDLVRDMTEALTSFCARLQGRPRTGQRRPSLCRTGCGSQGRGQAGTVRRRVTPAERDGLVGHPPSTTNCSSTVDPEFRSWNLDVYLR